MDHDAIEQGDLPERYATGRLATEERTSFEAHLVDCPQCLDRVEAAHGLAAGFLGLSSTEAAEASRPSPRRARPRWAARAGWGVAAAAAVALAVVWSARERSRLEAALAAERESRAALESQLRAAQAEADHARATPTPSPPRPPAAVPVLTLVATRGTSAPTLRLPEAPSPVVLSVERESPPRFHAYRVIVRSGGGQAVLDARVAPSSRDAVVLAVDSGLLQPGRYLLSMEAEDPHGGWKPVGRHPFEVVR